MDEEFDTSVDISDVDTSADIDTSDVDDVPEDIPEDIPENEPEIIEDDDLSEDMPEDVPEDEPEMPEEDDMSEDIPEDVPEDEPEMPEEDMSEDIPEDVSEEESEMPEEDDMSEDIPEDVSEEEPEMPEEDDMSEDIPEDVSEEEPEMPEEDDMSEDIPEDVCEEEPEMTGEDDLSEDIPEDVPKEEPEMSEENDLSDAVSDAAASDVDSGDFAELTEDTQDESMDDTTTDETTDAATSDVDSDDFAESTEDTQDKPMDDATTDRTTEGVASDADNGDSAKLTEDTQDESMGDTTADETAEDISSDVDSGYFNEQIDTQQEFADDTNGFNAGIKDDPSKVLKRDDLDLLKSGNDAINKRLEAQADDYRDKGMSEDEISDRLAADKWNFQKEFLEDAFPGQDVSPNVFNGLSKNGAKDRIADIENSDTLRNRLKADEADNALDNGSSPRKWDEDEWGPDTFKQTIKDVVGADEYKKYQDIYDTINNLGVSDTYKDTLVDQLKNMDSELKGLYNDYANDLKCLDTNYLGVANFDRTKGGFVFSETKDVNKGLGTGNTFFHESAHMMDWLTGENGEDLSVANDLTSAIQEDYNDALSNIMKMHNCSFEEAQSKLSDELWKYPIESNCVSDVFGGLSGNRVSGPWGHRADYWAKRPRSTVGQEAFAEITADSASNPQSLAFTKKYMPKTYNAYQNMIKGARKNG